MNHIFCPIKMFGERAQKDGGRVGSPVSRPQDLVRQHAAHPQVAAEPDQGGQTCHRQSARVCQGYHPPRSVSQN